MCGGSGRLPWTPRRPPLSPRDKAARHLSLLPLLCHPQARPPGLARTHAHTPGVHPRNTRGVAATRVLVVLRSLGRDVWPHHPGGGRQGHGVPAWAQGLGWSPHRCARVAPRSAQRAGVPRVMPGEGGGAVTRGAMRRQTCRSGTCLGGAGAAWACVPGHKGGQARRALPPEGVGRDAPLRSREEGGRRGVGRGAGWEARVGVTRWTAGLGWAGLG